MVDIIIKFMIDIIIKLFNIFEKLFVPITGILVIVKLLDREKFFNKISFFNSKGSYSGEHSIQAKEKKLYRNIIVQGIICILIINEYIDLLIIFFVVLGNMAVYFEFTKLEVGRWIMAILSSTIYIIAFCIGLLHIYAQYIVGINSIIEPYFYIIFLILIFIPYFYFLFPIFRNGEPKRKKH